MPHIHRPLIALFCLGLSFGALSAPLATGSPAPALTLEDQHGKPVAVTPATRLVLFAADKAASDLASEVLGQEKTGVLTRLQAAYLADISAMPSLVTRMFALPAMRELPFSIGLTRDAAVLADLPRQKGAVTVIRLADGQVGSVDYARDSAQLKQLLGLH